MMYRKKLENILSPYFASASSPNPDIKRFWVVADKDGLIGRVLELVNSQVSHSATGKPKLPPVEEMHPNDIVVEFGNPIAKWNYKRKNK